MYRTQASYLCTRYEILYLQSIFRKNLWTVFVHWVYVTVAKQDFRGNKGAKNLTQGIKCTTQDRYKSFSVAVLHSGLK
jgi:hypothetical protein